MKRSCHLLYLSSSNLKDEIFLRDFATYTQFVNPVIIIPDTNFETPEDAYFLNKKISAKLSEQMIPNLPLSSTHRKVLLTNPNGYELQYDLINTFLNTVKVLLLSPFNDSGMRINSMDLIHSLHQSRQFDWLETWLFPDNPLSPLGSSDETINSLAEINNLLKVYPEETKVLELSAKLLPVKIRLARTYPV